MKTKKQILMLLLAMLAGIPTLSAQTKKEKKEDVYKRQIIVCASFIKSALYFQLNDLLSFVPSLITTILGLKANAFL